MCGCVVEGLWCVVWYLVVCGGVVVWYVAVCYGVVVCRRGLVVWYVVVWCDRVVVV